MSILSDALAQAHAALSPFKGESLSYSATQAGTYTALTGFVLLKARVDPVMHDDERGMDMQMQGSTLKGPLTPALELGQFVKDSSVSPAQIYYVESVKVEAQQIANLRRASVLAGTPNRKANQ